MKTIFICTDGTWNKTLEIDNGQLAPTNVAKIARIIETRPDQLVYYDRGVGTSQINKIRGGMFGRGLFRNVKEAYRFLVENYTKDENGQYDQIALFGFSRGAYTARCLAGLISKCGILRKKYISDIDTVFDLYKDKEVNAKILEDYTYNFCHPNRDILFIGVWDTVGAMGVPLTSLNWIMRKRFDFHDTHLSENISHAYHALAIDEFRRQFKPTLWEAKNVKAKQKVEQRWFAGSHSNVGGGFSDSKLSDITLEWMVDKLTSCMPSVKIDTDYLKNLSPDPCGKLRGEIPIYYLISKIFKPKRKTNDKNYANQVIDESVYRKIECKGEDYNPSNVEPKV